MHETRKEPGVERTYRTDAIEVTWEPERCVHVATCFRTLGEVFKPKERPWVRLEGADADRVAEVVRMCPSGALRYRRLDDGPEEELPDPPEVEADDDGPLYIRGRVRILDEHGEVVRDEVGRHALCRCGHSGNLPFCDGTHWQVGYPPTEPPPA